ncbi:phage regulatory CII family protein [Yersinia kristensenii]|uniref:phage regulatory CII family protein n=1 Tax=Yersinia kristensenii TaxID=28152 RepID=UPI0011A5C989|nr:phage regulatory CII family protein [Yersinia kristensenii]
MFANGTDKHPHWDSALRRFADTVEIKRVAETIGMNPQTLRNKLNPAQPHELTTVELLRITHATQNYTLLDGALAELGRLPSLPLENPQEATDIPTQALKISSAAGELAGESLQLISGSRLTKKRKDAIVSRANKAVRDLMLFAYAIEEKFHSIPVLSTTFDIACNSSLPGLTY